MQAAQCWIERLWGWEDVSFWPGKMLEQGIHIQLRHASQADTTGRSRVYVEVGPGYLIAASGKPLIAGYPGRGQTVVYIAGGRRAFLAFRASLVMLTDPSESLDASLKSPAFETGRFAGGENPLEGGGRSRLGTGRIHSN